MNRLLPICLVLLLTACPPVRGDDDDSACEGEGTLVVCADYNGEGAEGSAWLRSGPEDDAPLESPLSDGCVAFTVTPGSWEWRATHATDTCESSWESVSVPTCETVEVSVDLMEWCFDGR